MSEPAFSLKDRVAIVSGGAQGIGLAVVTELVRQGARVVVVDNGAAIDGDAPDDVLVARALRAFGPDVTPVIRDIAAPETASVAVSTAVREYGSVDIVVNNAAILRDGFIFKGERANWERVIATNLTGAWALLAAATPAMREAAKAGRAPGRIINMISTAGLYGNFGQAAYASAKAALVGLTRVTAMDMARSKVTCNALAPFAATRVTDSIVPANESQSAYKARALQVPAAYVARLVAWLAAPGCELTGQILGVRGREVFLFSQSRPVARAITPTLDELSGGLLDAQLRREFGPHLVDLQTDLEAFNTDPIL